MAVLGIASRGGVKLNSSDYRQSRRLGWHGENPCDPDQHDMTHRLRRRSMGSGAGI